MAKKTTNLLSEDGIPALEIETQVTLTIDVESWDFEPYVADNLLDEDEEPTKADFIEWLNSLEGKKAVNEYIKDNLGYSPTIDKVVRVSIPDWKLSLSEE